MKKQQGIIIGVVILLLIGGAYFWWQFGNKPAATGEGIPTPKPSLEVVSDDTILGWLSRGAVECTVTNETGDMKIMAKNEKVRLEGMPYAFANDSAQTSNGVWISDGTWTYMWSGTQGTKINIKEMEKTMTPEQKTEVPDYNWTDAVKNWETAGFKYDCRETKLADDLFTPPADVNFNDLTATFTAAQQMGDKIKAGNMNTEDIEAELERIQGGMSGNTVNE